MSALLPIYASVRDVCCNCGTANQSLGSCNVNQGASPRRVAWIDVRDPAHRKREYITLILIGFNFMFVYFVISWCLSLQKPHKTKYSDNPPVEGHVGWVLTPNRSPHQPNVRTTPGSLGTSPSDSQLSTSPASIPKFQHPSHQLLRANGFEQQQYYKFRHNCLKGKSHLPDITLQMKCLCYNYISDN